MSTQTPTKATFVQRTACIACGGTDLHTLQKARFGEDPVRGFLSEDPWGVNPLPFIEEETWEFVQCRGCGQAFHKNLLTPDWQQVRFSEWMTGDAIKSYEKTHGLDTPAAHFGIATHNTAHVLRLEEMTRDLRGNDALRVLDFGCGWGRFLAMCALFGFTAVGVDRDEERQEASRGRGVQVLSDLAAASRYAGPFHAVTLFQVLEHIEEPMALLGEIRGHMLPGAILVLEVPNCSGVEGIATRHDYDCIHPLEHINAFTPDSLRAFAQRAGFAPVLPGVAHVTTNTAAVLKEQAKHFLPRLRKPSTYQYFRLV